MATTEYMVSPTNATSKTTYYGLPIFVEGQENKPSWLIDWNGTMNEIDEILRDMDRSQTVDHQQLNLLKSKVDQAEELIETIQQNLTDTAENVENNRTDINANKKSIDTIQDDLITQNALVKSLADSVTSLNNRVNQMTNTVNSLDPRVRTLENTAKVLDERVEVLEDTSTDSYGATKVFNFSSMPATIFTGIEPNSYYRFSITNASVNGLVIGTFIIQPSTLTGQPIHLIFRWYDARSELTTSYVSLSYSDTARQINLAEWSSDSLAGNKCLTLEKIAASS